MAAVRPTGGPASGGGPPSGLAAPLTREQAGSQAGGLKVFHDAGQTFITWREVDPPTLADAMTVTQLRDLKQASVPGMAITYRITDRTVRSRRCRACSLLAKCHRSRAGIPSAMGSTRSPRTRRPGM